MSNRVYITVTEEQDLNSNLEPIGERRKAVYVNCDSVHGYVGDIETKEDLMELVSPQNIIETINENLSDDDANDLTTILECRNGVYEIFGKQYQVKDL